MKVRLKKGWSRKVWIDALVVVTLSSRMGGGVLSDILAAGVWLKSSILEVGRSLCKRVKLEGEVGRGQVAGGGVEREKLTSETGRISRLSQ